MSAIVLKKLEKEIGSQTFDCGNSSINELIYQSYYPTILQHAYAFSILYNDYVIGYYMVRYKKIQLDDCPEEISDYRSNLLEDCISLHIEYLAIRKDFQKRGIGTVILKYIISSVKDLSMRWPIRLITIDAIKEKYDWYKNIGFLAFDENNLHDASSTISMFIDCLNDVEAVNTYLEQHLY